MRFLSRLLALLTGVLIATLAFARASSLYSDPVRIERGAVVRGIGGFTADQILSAFLAKDSRALEGMRLSKRYDSLTVSVHYSSGILDCPANPRRCEHIALSVAGWRENTAFLIGQVRFSLEDIVPPDRAQVMRLERSSAAELTAVVERLVYSDGRFTPEVWLLIRPEEPSMHGELPPNAVDQNAVRKRQQRQRLEEEGFYLANSSVNDDTARAAFPQVTRWFHLLGVVTPQNVDTIGPTTMWLLSTMLGIDPVRDVGH